MAVQRELDYDIDYGDPAASNGISVFDDAFDETFAYDGDDLGVTLSDGETRFRLWAPTASAAIVALYDSHDAGDAEELPMIRGERGTWEVAVDRSLTGKLYTYKVKIGSRWNEAVDPYAKAVGVNGDRGAIVDLAETNPERWTTERAPIRAVDAVIYELHVRDLSIHPFSGIRHKGKYLGLCEAGTTGPGGIATGLDHIASLGVTHVQLLPVFDYSTESVDETAPDGTSYNWGYDPKNYNAPEGSYATDPFDPACRIRELKQLIQALRDRGLRVVMDVVYNHVYDAYRIHFTKLVPGYFFRAKPDGSLSNGSGCGNDTASEKRMMRKFIVDSVLYWAKEYGMDGFRFDLMGLHDIETMNEIRRRLDEIDPSILMIGEGWELDTTLAAERRATMANASRMPAIAHFNDRFRNAVKGNIFDPQAGGFIGGDKFLEREIRLGAAGSIAYDGEHEGFCREPHQTVNYVECHDNHTLWDKLTTSNPNDSRETRIKRHRLATAIVLLSQGIPLLHAGQEFMRTKQGVENSYRSPDAINRLDWERCAEHQEDVRYVRELIALRKAHPAFRLATSEQIRRHLMFEHAPGHCVAFSLRDHAGGDSAKHLFVVLNANESAAEVPLPFRTRRVLFGEEGATFAAADKTVEVEGLSAVVLEME